MAYTSFLLQYEEQASIDGDNCNAFKTQTGTKGLPGGDTDYSSLHLATQTLKDGKGAPSDTDAASGSYFAIPRQSPTSGEAART